MKPAGETKAVIFYIPGYGDHVRNGAYILKAFAD